MAPAGKECNGLLADYTNSQTARDSKEAEAGLDAPPVAQRQTSVHYDGGYAWVVMACAFGVQFIAGGVAFVGGLFIVEFRETFGVSPEQVSWVVALNTGIAYGCSPLGGILSTYFGHRWVIFAGGIMTSLGLLLSAWANSIPVLCLTYGLIAGGGIALQYSPSVSVVAPYFGKKKALALGLTISGAALGPLVLPLLIRYLMDVFSWRVALILHAGIALHVCVLAALMFPMHLFDRTAIKPKLSRQNSTWREITSIVVLKDPVFYGQFANNLLWCIGISPLYMLLPDYAIELGMTKYQSSFLISIISFGNAIGRGGIAIFMNFCPVVNRTHVHNVATLLGGLVIAIYPLDNAFHTFASASICLGLLFGILVGSLPVVTSELYGPELLTNAFSYLMIADGLGFLIGPPISGAIYQVTGSYAIPFFINSAAYTLSGVIMYLTVCCKKRQPKSILETDVGIDGKVVVKPGGSV